ncbi:hypothetical protein [Variovorax saccharolyticus]|uniref:hypothetical protein n=1 Tax=Variovorax saccharolyticus TaxID=3053516 RepID=UPI0025750465|nr:hypothetical protein [Variovorax sp. J31P216]MDM0028331.1 hypothetical protein [Variovorax sp. J31P216]
MPDDGLDGSWTQPLDVSLGNFREAIRLALVRPHAERKGVEVLTQLADAGAVVSADRTQIQQVILNFLANAIEAMEPNESHPRELLVNSRRKHALPSFFGTANARKDIKPPGPGC